MNVISEAQQWSVKHGKSGSVAVLRDGKVVLRRAHGRDFQLAVEGTKRVAYEYEIRPDDDFPQGARYYVKTHVLASI